jgi:hypothetical protein
MTKIIKIDVTQELDIDGATPCSPCNCPIARAARRAGLTNATFGGRYLKWSEGVVVHSVLAPEEARIFAKAFDLRGLGASGFPPRPPFSFSIVIADPQTQGDTP